MPAPADVHALLAQADWLHRLARQLVASDEEAEDAVQETWVAALRNPPDPSRPARPWLAAVLRNFVRKEARRSSGRRTRDAELVSESSAHSPEDLLTSVETQRLLVDLVLALDEPYGPPSSFATTAALSPRRSRRSSVLRGERCDGV